jgi:DNA repair exonuclease SbcCD ATPase subunit
LADKRPTILVAGNHDATLTNKNRLDSLTPIVKALNHDNLYYLKDTEIYIIGNVLFNNYSVFDSADKYLKYKDIPSKYKNEVDYTIALFHGPVNNAVTDVGYTVTSRTIFTEIFDGHQMVMLGDIHKHQLLQQFDDSNEKPAIVYCGSLIQQDHGEELLGHGYVYWNLKNKTFKHVEIPNDYGFYTVEVKKGLLNTDIKTIPKKAKLRIKCIESVPSEIKSILAEVKKFSELTDISYVRVEEDTAVKNIIDSTEVSLQNVSDVNYQNNLIKEYLNNKNIKTTNEVMESIFKLNKELNDELKKQYTVKNIQWKPKMFEFDNMFSYGEGNVIDFTKMNGIMGLFSSNASGKSSILSALTFCLFDKCDRSNKAVHVLNSQKLTFKCKFNFELNGTDFFIERKGTSDKKGSVRVDVKFWKMENNKEVELNGEARRNTNDIIRDYIGKYEDFVLTVLSLQNGKDGSFIDMGQTDRKDLLAQFMGLTIFDNLHDIASKKANEITVLLKNFTNDDYVSKLNEINGNIELFNSSLIKENVLLDNILDEKENKNKLLLDLTKKLINTDLKNVDITLLEKNKISYEASISKAEKDAVLYKNKTDEIENNLSNVISQIKELDNKKLKINLDKYNKLKEKNNLLERDIDVKKTALRVKFEKLEKLKEHKYDPNCNFCINNIFVKDAKETEKIVDRDKNEIKGLMDISKIQKNDLSSLEWVIADSDTYESLMSTKNDLSDKKYKLANLILSNESLINKNKTDLTTTINDIANFYKQKDNIEINKKINNEIDIIKNSIRNMEIEYKTKNKHIIDLNGTLQYKLNEKKNIEEKINKVKELEIKNEYYKNYTLAINRDGIPYELIRQALPVIQREVNDILHQIVEFTVSLKTDGKNVSTYIVYEDKSWPLEMGSGLEKFVSSLAIRVALINISNLPRSTFMAVDEGFGCADKENLLSMSNLFGYLKTRFDFIWIISHLDEMRDMVDKHIEIKKENGFSKVVFN